MGIAIAALTRSGICGARLSGRHISTFTSTKTFLQPRSYILASPGLSKTPQISILTTRTPLPPTMSSNKTQTRGHAGHSHSHKHDNTYLTSANKKDAGVRITRIGLFVNLGMAVGKGVGGYVFHSQALIADAFHALTDLVSDFMTLATISWSLKPPTSRFPTGYGKVESLGALGVSGLLLFGGLGMGLNALDALYLQFFVDHMSGDHHHGLFSFLGHSHGHGVELPNINAAWLAAGSIVVKEWLYRASKSTEECFLLSPTDPCSHEDCQRAQVIRPSIQCCPSSNRLSYEYRGARHYWRCTRFHRCLLA